MFRIILDSELTASSRGPNINLLRNLRSGLVSLGADAAQPERLGFLSYGRLSASKRRGFLTSSGSLSALSVQGSKPEVSTNLQSAICNPTVTPALAACIALAIAIASWYSLGDNPDRDGVPAQLNAMAQEIAPGWVGNLSPEQEHKLRELWDALFKVCGVYGDGDSKRPDVSATDPRQPDEEVEVPRKKQGFRFFGSASRAATSASDDQHVDGSLHNDKFGLTKQYQEILASQKPEEIREALWSMIKHDHPDALVLRFLRARKWDVEKALVMIVTALNWRHSQMKVDQDIMKNGEAGAAADEKSGHGKSKTLGHEFLTQCRMGKSFLHGIDKNGRPICVVKACLHRANDQLPESLERYTVFIIETARLALKPPVDTASIIFDMTGFTLANMDYHSVKFMIKCFEANYPESLGAVLVHNAPWVFQGVWKLIRGWLDPVVASKVHFTNQRAGLEEFVNPDQIIKDLGGDEDWKYEYTEPVEGENHLMEDVQTRDRLVGERQKLCNLFEANTKQWIRHPEDEETRAIKMKRQELAAKLRDGYWKLDPYIRARCLYDRQNVIHPGGDVDWYSYKTTR